MDKLPVYKLVINDEDETGVNFVSLVTNPAIERDFQYFNQDFVNPRGGESENDFISRCVKVITGEGYDQDQAVAICYNYWKGEKFFDDYPKAASQNAQRGINLNEKVGNDCATLVGKNRSRQLIARENLSLETIKRTYSYLSSAKEYYNPSDTEACGTISYLLWGGDEMLRYTERKLEELELNKAKKKQKYDVDVSTLPGYITEDLPLFNTKEEAEAYAEKIGCTGSHKMGDKYMPCSAEEAHTDIETPLKAHSHQIGFAIQDEEKRIITGMAMEAEKRIYRYDAARGEYYVYFDADTIFQIAKKWAKSDLYDSVNIHHEKETKGLSLFESYIVDRERGKYPPKGYDEVADGSWFLSYIVNDDDIWARVKNGEFKGFSVEGFFDFDVNEEERQLNAIYNAVKKAVEKWDGKN